MEREEIKKAEGSKTPFKHTQYDNRHIGVNKGIDTLSPDFSEQNPNIGATAPLVGEKERIFKKTYRIIERPYLTVEQSKPKQKRRSPILRKCEDLMEELWEAGYRKQITWELLEDYVIRVCGGFRTTRIDYLGSRDQFYTSRGRQGILKRKGKPGYLERFGFIERKSPKLFSLIHERVGRSYHYVQSDVVSFSLSNCQRSDVESKASVDAIEIERTERDTKREREINCLHENVKRLTAEELRILRASEGGG